MNTFFTGDLHLYHRNIIKHCDRPFKSIDEMNEVLIANWNEVVGKRDKVYVLGDFCWKSGVRFLNDLTRKLNGKIHLIEGNHDKPHIYKADFRSVDKLKTIKIGGDKIVLCHYPLRSWDSKIHGSYHLYGHVHGTISNPIANSIDVGVDAWGYYPVRWEEVKKVLDE